ncbi:MAG: C4-dicarboxylate transporter DctA [Phycisphaerae bacterium]|nr:C4-dicarboxylate transporter DctA [Tepidisphaeraceae bacterium]
MAATTLDYDDGGGPPPARKPLWKNLTFQVLVAVAIGAAIGGIWPNVGKGLEPVAKGFIRLVKLVVGPIIFLTIVVGIAGLGDLKKVGRVGLKALFYFEVVTTIALGIGMLVAHVVKPGAGIDTSKAVVTKEVEAYKAKGEKLLSFSDHVLESIPNNVAAAFAGDDLVPVLVFSVLFGCAVAGLGPRGQPILYGCEFLVEVFFKLVAIIMRAAPLGALGAMAFTVGNFGWGSLWSLAKLMVCVYATMGVFIFLILGLICRFAGFSLWQYLKFIRQEIVLVLGTSSSESALPRMMEKLEAMGCGRDVVRLVIPSGYSFNLDGTSIYLSMALLFIAQAYNLHLSFWHQLYLLAILMLTSKGAAAVTGGGFITLSATIAATSKNPVETRLPVEGLSLVFGVDRFMSEARAITNLIGNGVATIVVAKWEGQFDQAMYDAAIAGRPMPARGVTPELVADEIAGGDVRVESRLERT